MNISKRLTWQEVKKYTKKRKQDLLNHNPRCCYCGVVTVYGKKKKGELNSRYPTIEHLYPVTDLRRYCIKGEKQVTIACNKCNVEKSKESGQFKNQPKEVKGLLMDIYNGHYSDVFII